MLYAREFFVNNLNINVCYVYLFKIADNVTRMGFLDDRQRSDFPTGNAKCQIHNPPTIPRELKAIAS